MNHSKAIFSLIDEYYPQYLAWAIRAEPEYLIVKRVNSNYIRDLQSLIAALTLAPVAIQNVDRITLLDTCTGEMEPLPGLLLQVGLCCRVNHPSSSSVIVDPYGRRWPLVDQSAPRPTILHAMHGVIKYNRSTGV